MKLPECSSFTLAQLEADVRQGRMVALSFGFDGPDASRHVSRLLTEHLWQETAITARHLEAHMTQAVAGAHPLIRSDN